MKLAESTFS